jgi:hypothetical protein
MGCLYSHMLYEMHKDAYGLSIVPVPHSGKLYGGMAIRMTGRAPA